MGRGKRRRTGPPPPPAPHASVDHTTIEQRPHRGLGVALVVAALAVLVTAVCLIRKLRGPVIESIRGLCQSEPHAAMLVMWVLLCAPIWSSLLIAALRDSVLAARARQAWALGLSVLAWVPLAMFTPLWRDGPHGLREDFLQHGYGVAEAMYSGYYAGFIALVGGLTAPLLVLTAIGALPHGEGRTRVLSRAMVAAPGAVAVVALAWQWAQTFD